MMSFAVPQAYPQNAAISCHSVVLEELPEDIHVVTEESPEDTHAVNEEESFCPK
jgi:hypothetical protein